MKILVTGGAGYIGSFMVRRLISEGYEVVVLDSLERGFREAIDPKATFVQGSLLDKKFISDFVSTHNFDGAIHFAGYISMAESMQNPYIYFENNTYGAINLIEEMRKKSTKNFIFSSSAGVYGNPQTIPIPEDHQKNPTNPYGESKAMTEKILEWYWKIFKFSSICLRYFNASGAAIDGSLGERHNPETHIIPCAIKAVLTNSEFTMYGSDYDTPDGTCVRDYIHVLDLVEAHMLGLKKLFDNPGGYVYNVGTGHGYSNKEVVDMVKKISAKDLRIKNEARRPGDASSLIADASKIENDLGFSPKYSDLETIVKSAYLWHSKQA